MSSTNELSSLSYTNKDFNSIYVELLEYAKKISHKWDPSNSTESDPGVVLLKLCALIGDKNNYNIDKNVLEVMPASVTQMPAARQVFEQCGYSMKYYRAAEGQVTFSLKKIPSEVSDYFEALEEGSTKPSTYDLSNITYNVPAFTMLTDVDASVVYTIKPNNTLVWSEQQQIFEVIEGIATEYTINNDSLITLANLDYNNRLYFTDMNIAENGIFITNVNKDTYNDWNRVDNLEVQPPKTYCYKFGLTLDGSMCYIEFPEDVNYLFGDGINITYIKTEGANGNVASRKLTDFYSTTSFEFKNRDTEDIYGSCEVTSDIVGIKNLMPINNGQDPESIDDAYRSYKRVRNTFDTLVTLQDYNNYLISNEKVSNGYVCDRTNDIQYTYKVQEIDNYVNVLKTQIRPITEQVEGFVEDSEGNKQIITCSISKPALMPYDLTVYALEPIGEITTNMSDSEGAELFKKSFDIMTNIITTNDLTTNAIAEYVSEVKSLQHDFKEFATDTILMIRNKYQIKAHIIPRNVLSTVERHEVTKNVKTALYNAVNSKHLEFGKAVSYDILYDTINNADERIKAASVSYPIYETYAVYKDSAGNITDLRIDDDSDIPEEDHRAELWNKFRTEIFAKNVLCGTTPLYDKDSKFIYGLNQTNPVITEDIKYITTNTNISGVVKDSYCEYNTILKNESILLTAPNFVEEPNYPNFSSYVKVLYKLTYENDKDVISANSKYELRDDDYIIFFWKSADTNNYYDFIKYDSSKASLAKFISPTFSMYKKQGLMADTAGNHVADAMFKEVPVGVRYTTNLVSGTIYYDEKYLTASEFISSLNKSSAENLHVLSGTNIINLFKDNKIQINNTKTGCKNIYWILNNSDNTIPWANNKYTLKTGEYFLYTNDSKTTMHILGEGTLLEKSEKISPLNTHNNSWTCSTIEYNKLMLEGIDYIENWVRINLSDDDSEKLFATEMQRHLIGPDNKLILTKNKDYIGVDEDGDPIPVHYPNQFEGYNETETYVYSYLSSEETPLENFNISYKDSNGVIQQIEQLDSSTIFWSAQTILNLNMTSEEPQELYDHQSLELYQDISEPAISTIQGSGSPNDSEVNPTCVLSSVSLNLVGGEQTDVRAYSIQEDKYTGIDIFEYNVPINTANLTYQTNKFIVNVTSESIQDSIVSVSVPFDLPEGKYIIHVVTNDVLSELSIESNSVSSVYNNDVCYFYYLTVDSNSDNELEIHYKVAAEDEDKKVTLSIQPLYKYNNTTLDSIDFADTGDEITTFEQSVVKTVFDLDLDKKFDCTYVPEDFIMIKNPLESDSFHNSKHFYNKFTIDMWHQNDDDTSIEVTNNIR